MLGVKDQHQIQQPGLLPGVTLVLAAHAQEVLRHAQLGVRIMDIERFAVKGVAFHRVGVRHDGGEAADQFDGLAHDVLHRDIVRAVVVGVEHQHAALQLVHNASGRGLQDHILKETVRQLPRGGQNGIEALKLLLRGQLSEQKQVGDLLVPEGAEALVHGENLIDVDPAVVQLAGDGDFLKVPEVIALDAADPRDARHYAGAVDVAQSALHRVALVIAWIDTVFVLHFRTQRGNIAVQFFLVDVQDLHFPFRVIPDSIDGIPIKCKLLF